MTKTQEKKIDFLRELAEDHAATSGHDIIKFEVDEISDMTTSVCIWFGKGGADMWIKETAHFFVKTRGKVEYPYHPVGDIYKTIYRNFNGKTLPKVIREQRYPL